MKDVWKSTLVRSRRQEEMNGLVEGRTGFHSRSTGAHDIEWHGVGHELIAFFPDMNGIFDVHQFHPITKEHCALG
jgi:hypothetical protein